VRTFLFSKLARNPQSGGVAREPFAVGLARVEQGYLLGVPPDGPGGKTSAYGEHCRRYLERISIRVAEAGCAHNKGFRQKAPTRLTT
jgi:hypothetical protein